MVITATPYAFDINGTIALARMAGLPAIGRIRYHGQTCAKPAERKEPRQCRTTPR
jgi:hypothetical protein